MNIPYLAWSRPAKTIFHKGALWGTRMYVDFSRQYVSSCIVVEPGDRVDDVIAKAIEEGAWLYEELGDQRKDIKAFVVVLPSADRIVGPEVYTEKALRASFSDDGAYQTFARTA